MLLANMLALAWITIMIGVTGTVICNLFNLGLRKVWNFVTTRIWSFTNSIDKKILTTRVQPNLAAVAKS